MGYHGRAKKPPETEPDFTGKWAVSGSYRVGKIEGRRKLTSGEAWVGRCLDGSLWYSNYPTIIDDRDAMILDQLVSLSELKRT